MARGELIFLQKTFKNNAHIPLQLKDFVTNRSKIFEKSSQGIKQSLETVTIHSQWQASNYKSIGRYLKNYLAK